MSRILRQRSDGRCATAGCERALHDLAAIYCKPCEAAYRALPVVPSAEPSLFDAPRAAMLRASLPEQHTRPIAGKAATSKKAAAAVECTYHSRKTLIHEHIKGEGARGATRPEIAAALGLPSVNSVNSAANTLYRQGLIGSNVGDERADPHTGNMCAVLVHEAFVARWYGTTRRERSMLFDLAAECDLVHPETGEPLTERDRDKLTSLRADTEQCFP